MKLILGTPLCWQIYSGTCHLYAVSNIPTALATATWARHNTLQFTLPCSLIIALQRNEKPLLFIKIQKHRGTIIQFQGYLKCSYTFFYKCCVHKTCILCQVRINRIRLYVLSVFKLRTRIKYWKYKVNISQHVLFIVMGPEKFRY